MIPSVAHLFGGARVFRVALLGSTEAGKTCLLAALGSAGGPAGTCHRVLEPPADAQHGGPPDGPVARFREAGEVLGNAERAMRAGETPDATDPRRPPMLAVYQFAAPGAGQLTVEIADYSGELLDPHSGVYTENRRALSELLDGCDALVVLADAPRPGAVPSSVQFLSAVLDRFHSWVAARRAGAKVPVPVALVFTKWDRRQPSDVPPAARDAALTEFVGAGEYRELVRTLRSVCDTVEVFAASAFGWHRPPAAGAAGERPRDFPKGTFGLVEPFLWACDAAVKHEAAELASVVDRLRWWKVWEVRPASRARALGHRLRERTAPGTPAHEAGGAAARRCSRLLVAQPVLAALAAALLLFVALPVGEWLAHDGRLREAERTLNDATADDTRYAAARNQLTEYAGTSRFRHLLTGLRLDRNRAAALVSDADRGREDRAWQAVEGARGDEIRDDLAAAYVQRYPSGRHADDARRRVAERQSRDRAAAAEEAIKQAQEKRAAEVEAIKQSFSRAERAGSESAMDEALQRLRKLPPVATGVETEGGRNYIATLDRYMSGKLDEVTTDATRRQRLRAWEPYRQRIARGLETFDLRGAATALHEAGQQPAAEADALRAREAFPEQALERVRVEKEGALKQTQHAAIRSAVSALDAALGDATFARLTAAHGNALRGLRDEIARRHDRLLYEQFASRPDPAGARQFLAEALLDGMKPAMRSYLEQTEGLSARHPTRLVLTVDWGKWPNASDNEVLVERHTPWGAGEWTEEIARHKAESKRDGSSNELASEPFPVIPNQPFGFRVTVTRRAAFVTNESLQAGAEVKQGHYTAQALGSGVQLDLSQQVGSDRGAKVAVRLADLPAPPAVPAWRE